LAVDKVIAVIILCFFVVCSVVCQMTVLVLIDNIWLHFRE